MTADSEGLDTLRAVGREHPLVRRTRVALERIDAEIVEDARWHAERDERRRKGLRVEFDFSPLTLYRKVREGGTILAAGDVASVIVTPRLRDRALALLYSVISQLAEHKLKVWVSDGKTFVGLESKQVGHSGYAFELRISEITEKSARAPDIPHAPDGWIATGRLRITVRSGPRGDFRIRDEGTTVVEELVPKLISYIVDAISGAPERERQAAEARSAYEAQREAERRALAEQQHAADTRRQAEIAAAARRRQLYREAMAWRRAADVRAYVEAVLASAPGNGLERSAMATWAEWALQAADALDPIASKLEQFGYAEDKREPPTEPDIGQTPSAEEERDD